jgi:hypothetical protein
LHCMRGWVIFLPLEMHQIHDVSGKKSRDRKPEKRLRSLL